MTICANDDTTRPDDTVEPEAGSPIAAALRSAFPLTLPVLAGYIFLGSAYGVLMGKLGYGPGWTVGMSVLVFGGSIQFVATSLLATGFQPLYAFLISLLVNARHLFYGVGMLEKYAGTGWKKPLLIFGLTDETFSLLCGDPPEGVDPAWHRLFVTLLDYSYWITGSLVGNLAGAAFAFDAKGIDFVMTALFLVIFITQWQSTKRREPALIGITASLACLLVFGGGYFLIPAMAGITLLLFAIRGRLEKGEEL